MNPLILAHRGSQKINGFPENTIPAFQEALDLGAHGIELDIRLTADREIIVYHDSDLNRHFGIKQKISRLTLQQTTRFQPGDELRSSDPSRRHKRTSGAGD